MKITIAAILILIATCYADTCSLTARIDLVSTPTDGSTYSIFRLTINNTGTCLITDMQIPIADHAFVSTGVGAATLDDDNSKGVGPGTPGSAGLTGFGATLVPGASWNDALLRLSFFRVATPTSTSISVQPTCSHVCTPIVTQSGCSARAATQYRSINISSDGSYPATATYDVYIVNQGSCVIQNAVLNISQPNTIVSTQILRKNAADNTLSFSSASIAATQNQNMIVGSITVSLDNGLTSTYLTQVKSLGCAAGCAQQTNPGSSSCRASASIDLQSPTATWQGADHNYNGAFDLKVTNSGNCTLTAVSVQVQPSGNADVQNAWNLLQANDGTYQVQNFYQLSKGQTFSGAGFIGTFRNGQQATSSSFAVHVASTTCLPC